MNMDLWRFFKVDQFLLNWALLIACVPYGVIHSSLLDFNVDL